MEAGYNWAPLFEKRLSFHIWGHEGRDRSLDVRSYDPAILLASKMHAGEMVHRMLWLHQFTLLPRCPRGSSLSISVSPHIDTSESVGSEDVQRKHLADRWLIALNDFSSSCLSVDDDVDSSKGQFFYEAVDLESCVKYLDQVADPDDGTRSTVSVEVSLNRELWSRHEERRLGIRIFVGGLTEMHVAFPKGSIARAHRAELAFGGL